jgi:hypothetical protein
MGMEGVLLGATLGVGLLTCLLIVLGTYLTGRSFWH